MTTETPQNPQKTLETEAREVAAAIPLMLRPQLAPTAALLIRMAQEIDTLKGHTHGRETDPRG